MMDSYITKDGKKLRRGYTTGACAAAAAKAAALMLLDGRPLDSVYLMTPFGIGLTLAVQEAKISDTAASCGIVKDSGDDPDVTNGITIYASVEKTQKPGIRIDGGAGIGRVTKPGLDQPVGSAAINSVPRRMIEDELRQVCEDCGWQAGLSVTIYAPAGAALAKRTFNPRLGITGGISILGTTGIVEPMSDDAVVSTIRAQLSQKRAAGERIAVFVPGNFGAAFLKKELAFDPDRAVPVSNFVGDAFAIADELGFDGAVLVGHIGKLVKLAGGLFQTHSRWGDCRAEIFASHAGLCGAKTETIRLLMESAAAEDMLDILERAGIRETVMKSICSRIADQLAQRPLRLIREAAVFSTRYGLLGMTPNAARLLQQAKENA